MLYRSSVVAVCAWIAIMSINANAELISADWKTPNDNLITRDTDTGLEWLDLTETTNLSYNQVNRLLQPGGKLEGWAFATPTDVRRLFESAGCVGTECEFKSEENIDEATLLLDLWGTTYSTDSHILSFALTKSPNNNDLFIFRIRLDYPGVYGSGAYLTLPGIITNLNYRDPFYGFSLVRTSTAPVQIVIDIKPDSDENSINISSAGVIPVAIYSSAEFDATTIDPTSISLAGASVKMVGKSDKYLCHQEDVNADGLDDLVCQVYTAQFMIEEGETTAILEAETMDGVKVRGEDIIRIVPD